MKSRKEPEANQRAEATRWTRPEIWEGALAILRSPRRASRVIVRPRIMRIPFFRSKRFEPDFPIVPLNVSEDEAHRILSQHADVMREDPEGDSTIAQHLLVASTEETRVTAGIWDGRVRFTNYRTSRFNDSDELKGRKLQWFVDYYGGAAEFGEPQDTGFMIFLRNRKRKLTIVFGLHMGPVRVIDEDPEHWPESK